MSREHNGVVVVRQDIFNLLPETAASHLHRLSGKLIQTIFALPRACNRPATGDIEPEIFGAGLEVPIHIATPKRRVSLSDY